MSKWPIKEVQVSRLRFDKLNARFLRRYSTKKEIISYLIENYKITELTKSIVKNKYMTGDIIVAIEEGNNYVVVEGNRRLCALTAITQFDIIPDDFKADFPNIPDSLTKSLMEVPISIAPNRRAAEHYVTERHLTSSKADWSVPAKITRTGLKFFKDKETVPTICSDLGMTASEVKRDLREYALYQLMLKCKWTKAEKNALIDEKLKLNPYIYVFQAKGILQKLKVKFSDGFKISSDIDSDVFRLVIKDIAAASLLPNEAGTIALNTRSDIHAFVDHSLLKHLPKEEDIPIEISGTSQGSEGNNNSNSGSPTNTVNSDHHIDASPGNNPNRLYSHLNSKITDDHVIKLLQEVSTFPFKKYPHASAGLLRIFLEVLFRYHYGGTDVSKKSIEQLVNFHISKETYGNSMKKVLTDFNKTGLVKLDAIIHGHQVGNSATVKQVADQMYQLVKIALSKVGKIT